MQRVLTIFPSKKHPENAMIFRTIAEEKSMIHKLYLADFPKEKSYSRRYKNKQKEDYYGRQSNSQNRGQRIRITRS